MSRRLRWEQVPLAVSQFSFSWAKENLKIWNERYRPWMGVAEHDGFLEFHADGDGESHGVVMEEVLMPGDETCIVSCHGRDRRRFLPREKEVATRE